MANPGITAPSSATQMKTNLQNNLQNVLSQLSPSQKANLQQKTSDLSAMIAEIQRDCYKGGVTGISGSGISGFEPELQLQELRTCDTNVKRRHGYVSPAQQKRNSAFDSLFRQELQVAPQNNMQSLAESRSVATPYSGSLTPSLYSQPPSQQYSNQFSGTSTVYQPRYPSNVYQGNQYQNRYQYQQPRQNGLFNMFG